MLIPSGRVMLSASVSGNANAFPHPAQSTPRPTGRCGYRHLDASLHVSHTALHLQRQVRAVPLAAPAPRQSRSLAESEAQAGRRVAPMNRGSVVSRFRLRQGFAGQMPRPLVIFGNPPFLKHLPDTISKSRLRAQHDGAKGLTQTAVPNPRQPATESGGVRAAARTRRISTIPTRHPLDPGNMPSVPSSRTQKAHSACCPRVAAKWRHGNRAVISPLSRPDAHPPPLCRPRPIGPKKESPQSRAGCRPCKLRVHPALHCVLAVHRPQTVCVNRAAGGVPVAPAGMPPQ